MSHFRKLLFVPLLLLGYPLSLYSQVLADRIAEKTCSCLSGFTSYKQLNDSLRVCLSRAVSEQMPVCTPEEKQALSTLEGIQGTLRQVKEILPSTCYIIRKLVVEEKSKMFYKMSSDSLANEYYHQGNGLLESGSYEQAIEKYEAAAARDTAFVYALDNLAKAYRLEKNYKKAIKGYERSLDIFPEGNVAILNMAEVYSLSGNEKEALKYYKNLVYLYKDDPDGHFGLGKILFSQGKYEEGLDHLFAAYASFLSSSSPSLKECEQTLLKAFEKMKKENKAYLFREMEEKYKVSVAHGA